MKNILLLEDNESIIMGLKYSLEQEGFDVETAKSVSDAKNKINENVLNNNSLVCKLEYKSFSIMLTGDIEKIAENAILTKYKNNAKILKANILKVAHHRL